MWNKKLEKMTPWNNISDIYVNLNFLRMLDSNNQDSGINYELDSFDDTFINPANETAIWSKEKNSSVSVVRIIVVCLF